MIGRDGRQTILVTLTKYRVVGGSATGKLIYLNRAACFCQTKLKQAFEGKLVPQHPNDEPADKLTGADQGETEKRTGKETM